ncbi:cupin domain-containing protein [Rhabdothermincola salaria]|uniref:cupin domain-containing protein n=1 Tax=Rhabdothermincola salaria TaxID=2903142 RepID=UPI001E353CDA|nr:cupin domain-containing protein [Rhabdothermincola salaria]MCD9623811.1 cupin domain-containing protein [Rhabdothermincola salaria]
MAGIVFAPVGDRGPARRPSSYEPVTGVQRTAADLGDVPLWLEDVELAPGSELVFRPDHGEEALFVLEGVVDVDGEGCGAGGAVIVEAGARPRVRADEPARLVHFGRQAADRREADVARPATHHVVGPEGTYAREDDERRTRFFADSDCDGCAITLFTTGRTSAYTSAPHSHSAPEILYVVDGTIAFGRRRLGPGDAVGIAADRRYGFRSDGAFTFLNYRPGPSSMTAERGGRPRPEGARAHGFERVAQP